MRVLAWLDTLGHWLGLRGKWFGAICDAYDRALGVPAQGESRLVDRFICRREGHVPSYKITGWSGIVPADHYICTCSRCGKAFEAKWPENAS